MFSAILKAPPSGEMPPPSPSASGAIGVMSGAAPVAGSALSKSGGGGVAPPSTPPDRNCALLGSTALAIAPPRLDHGLASAIGFENGDGWLMTIAGADVGAGGCTPSV